MGELIWEDGSNKAGHTKWEGTAGWSDWAEAQVKWAGEAGQAEPNGVRQAVPIRQMKQGKLVTMSYNELQ